MAAKKKTHLNVVVVGHVDHGKSTMMGHFLVKVGAVDPRLVEKYREEAKAIGRESWAYAWVLDKLKEERQRGLTIDLGYNKFETKKYYYTLIDAPGHRDFIKNMITGASQADVAILVVSAKPNEFEAGMSFGGQTREHAILCKTLGIDQIIVCISKMDAVNYDQATFEREKQELVKFLKSIGYWPKEEIEKLVKAGKLSPEAAKRLGKIIAIIPVSGLYGDNLVERSDKTPWYKGPTLYEALDMVEPPKPLIDKPFRLPIQKVYSIKGVGTVVTGRVESGVLKTGDDVLILPLGKKSKAFSIEMHHERLEEAKPGDNVGVNVKGISRDEVKRGDVMCHPHSPPPVVGQLGDTIYGYIIARFICIWHPTSIAAGYTPVMHAHTLQVAVKFVELLKKIDPKTGEVVEEKPSFIRKGEAALVKLLPQKPCCLERFRDIPPLGRFAIRDMGRLIGVGVVEDIEIVKKFEVK